MATIEEVRSKLKDRLGKFKVQTPTRVAYLGDGRGNATSNMVPVGEPNKFWARESLDGDKPFKITNKNPNLTPAFNLPVLLGYPEYDPETEQVLGLHSALIKLDAGGNVSGSSIGGAPPHHQKHEWGGGDTVYVDPRMFKPGLVKPTSPASMRVKVLSFQHYYNYWRRYDGGTSPDLTQYIPSSNYRYVMLTLDPDTNQLNVHPGAVFTPDLSIDSIISNQATNTFRHIPVPPGNEIPLGVALLESGTTKIDWNPEGINNLLPMRILLSTPMKEINERISLIESATGISSLPQTGAANAVETDLLPGRIDGNITRLVHARSATSTTLPVLLVGEIGYVNTAPSRLVMGTASGNQLISFGSGGGASVLDELDDVRIQDLTFRKALVYDNAASTWTSSSNIIIPWFQVRPSDDGQLSVDFSSGETAFYGLGAPVIIYDEGTNMLLGTGWSGSWLEFNGDLQPVYARFNGQTGVMFEIDAENEVSRFKTTSASRAMSVDYANDAIEVSPDVNLFKYGTSTIDGDSFVFFAGGHGFHVGGSAATGVLDRLVLYELDTNESLKISARSRPGAAELFRFTKYGRHPSLPADVAYSMETLSAITVTAGNEDAEWSLHTKISGTMGSRITVGANETLFNGARIDHDTKIASSANASMFVVDAGLGAVQIGTSVAGQIVDFRDHLIEFNKNQNAINITFSGQASQALLCLVDDNIGIGTNSPSRSFHFVGPDGPVSSFPSIGAKDVFLLENNSNTNFGFIGASNGNVSFKFYKSGASNFHGLINYDFTNEQMYFTAQGGARKMTLRQGLDIGLPTSGGDFFGWINVQNGIQRNGTAYNNPDYAVEHYFNGSIVRFINNPGAANYKGLVPLSCLESYLKDNFHLPNRWESNNLFDWADMSQMWSEELAIYITQLHNRVQVLELELKGKIKLESKLNELEARLMALEII